MKECDPREATMFHSLTDKVGRHHVILGFGVTFNVNEEELALHPSVRSQPLGSTFEVHATREITDHSAQFCFKLHSDGCPFELDQLPPRTQAPGPTRRISLLIRRAAVRLYGVFWVICPGSTSRPQQSFSGRRNTRATGWSELSSISTAWNQSRQCC